MESKSPFGGNRPATEANYSSNDPRSESIMQFFQFEHLPDKLQETSKMFAALAANVIITTPRNPERTVALRKLLEAKDAAVRAMIFRS